MGGLGRGLFIGALPSRAFVIARHLRLALRLGLALWVDNPAGPATVHLFACAARPFFRRKKERAK